MSEQVVTRQLGSEPALGRVSLGWAGSRARAEGLSRSSGDLVFEAESTDLKDLGHLVFGVKGCGPRELHVRVYSVLVTDTLLVLRQALACGYLYVEVPTILEEVL